MENLPQGQQGKNQLTQNSAQAETGKRMLGRTDDKIAQDIGFGSRDTYRKAQYIYENGSEELIKKKTI